MSSTWLDPHLNTAYNSSALNLASTVTSQRDGNFSYFLLALTDLPISCQQMSHREKQKSPSHQVVFCFFVCLLLLFVLWVWDKPTYHGEEGIQTRIETDTRIMGFCCDRWSYVVCGRTVERLLEVWVEKATECSTLTNPFCESLEDDVENSADKED